MTALSIEWAGGQHTFNLNTRAIRDILEGRSGVSPIVVTRNGFLTLAPLTGQYGDTPTACLRRFREDVYSITDVERVLLYGLWGGGMSLIDADDHVEQYVRTKPLLRNAATAVSALTTLIG